MLLTINRNPDNPARAEKNVSRVTCSLFQRSDGFNLWFWLFKRNYTAVIPAEAGIHASRALDSRLRGSDDTV
jgi:hypothetical protein